MSEPTERSDKRLEIRLSQELYDLIQRAAGLTSVSAWLRDRARTAARRELKRRGH